MKAGSGFVTFFPSFSFGDDALLILADYETIDWLMAQFGRLSNAPLRSSRASFVVEASIQLESTNEGDAADRSGNSQKQTHCGLRAMPE